MRVIASAMRRLQRSFTENSHAGRNAVMRQSSEVPSDYEMLGYPKSGGSEVERRKLLAADMMEAIALNNLHSGSPCQEDIEQLKNADYRRQEILLTMSDDNPLIDYVSRDIALFKDNKSPFIVRYHESKEGSVSEEGLPPLHDVGRIEQQRTDFIQQFDTLLQQSLPEVERPMPEIQQNARVLWDALFDRGYMNGQDSSRQTLSHGDHVRLGNLTMGRDDPDIASLLTPRSFMNDLRHRYNSFSEDEDPS